MNETERLAEVAALHHERKRKAEELRNLVGPTWKVVPCWPDSVVSSMSPRYPQSVGKTRKAGFPRPSVCLFPWTRHHQ